MNAFSVLYNIQWFLCLFNLFPFIWLEFFSSEMNRLHLQSSARAQLDVLKKDKVTKEEQIRRL